MKKISLIKQKSHISIILDGEKISLIKQNGRKVAFLSCLPQHTHMKDPATARCLSGPEGRGQVFIAIKDNVSEFKQVM